MWWESLSAADRHKVRALPTIQRVTAGAKEQGWIDTPFNPAVRDALIEALFASGSNLLLLPVQDVFGWRDRINEPATVSDRNWSYRLPWLSDRLDDVPEARERGRPFSTGAQCISDSRSGWLQAVVRLKADATAARSTAGLGRCSAEPLAAACVAACRPDSRHRTRRTPR